MALHHACLTRCISPAPPASSLLRGARGAEAELQHGGRHLELRRHPVHPAQRRAALLGRDGEADLQGHPGGGGGDERGGVCAAAMHSVSAAASSAGEHATSMQPAVLPTGMRWSSAGPCPCPALTHHLRPVIAGCRATWTSRATPGPRFVYAAKHTSSMCFLRTETPQHIAHIAHSAHPPPPPPASAPQISDEAKDCVRRMLEPNPAKRATAQEILQVWGGRGRRDRLGWLVGRRDAGSTAATLPSEGDFARLALELTPPTAAVPPSRCRSTSGCAKTAWPPTSRWTMSSSSA